MKRYIIAASALLLCVGATDLSAQDFYTKVNKRASITTLPTMVEYGPASGVLNGHEWVDLGLPSGLKWATCNLGSDAIDQDGNHYKWGDVTGYHSKGSYAKEDVQKDISGDAGYDAATVLWGEG